MARFCSFFTLFHVILTFFRPEVPIKIAQTCNLKSDHNIHNNVQASLGELTSMYWFQMAIT